MDKNKPKTHDQMVEELNANLPMLFRPLRKCNQQKNVVPIKEPQGPNEYLDEQGTASAVIHRTNESTDNGHLNKAIVGRMNDEILTVLTVPENIEMVNAASHFPKLSSLLEVHGTDILIRSRRDMTDQRTIDSIVDQLNDKSKHMYKLLFELATLRNSKRKDSFFAPIINYLEDNHLPSN